jgi:hypothetical protein
MKQTIKSKDMKTVLLSLLFTLLFLNGCKEDDLITFDNANHAVVFPDLGDRVTYTGYNTTLKVYISTFSFLTVPMGTPSATATLPVRVTGVPVPYDREVGVQILEEGTTAATGQYRFLRAWIPANKAYGTIEIEVDYADELLTEERTISIALIPSKDLNAGPREYTKGLLVWHCQLPPPTVTSVIRTYNYLIAGMAAPTSTSMNYYSPAAHRLILDACGWEELPAYSIAPYYVYSNAPAYRQKLREYIAAWDIDHPDEPLLHNGGLSIGRPIQIRAE